MTAFPAVSLAPVAGLGARAARALTAEFARHNEPTSALIVRPPPRWTASRPSSSPIDATSSRRSRLVRAKARISGRACAHRCS